MNPELFNRFYAQEVLGIQHYICPQSIKDLRQIKGSWGEGVLVVLLEPLQPTQQPLLKKIMASVAVTKYSVLQIKELSLLKALKGFSKQQAGEIFLFGLKDSSEELKHSCDPFFSSPYSLKELEGTSVEVNNKKQALWRELQKFKRG